MILHVTWVTYLHFLLLTIIEPSELIFETYRRSRSEMFFKIGVLKSFAKFTGKTLGPSLFLTLFKKRYWHRCFPVNFATFLRIIPFVYRTPPVAASWRIHDSRKSLRKAALQEALLFTFAWVWILLGLVLINWRKSNQEMLKTFFYSKTISDLIMKEIDLWIIYVVISRRLSPVFSNIVFRFKRPPSAAYKKQRLIFQ